MLEYLSYVSYIHTTYIYINEKTKFVNFIYERQTEGRILQ